MQNMILKPQTACDSRINSEINQVMSNTDNANIALVKITAKKRGELLDKVVFLSTEPQINRYFTAKGNHKGLPLHNVM